MWLCSIIHGLKQYIYYIFSDYWCLLSPYKPDTLPKWTLSFFSDQKHSIKQVLLQEVGGSLAVICGLTQSHQNSCKQSVYL